MKSILLSMMVCLLSAGPVFAMGRSASGGVSLLLVPASPPMVQVGMDMARMGEAVLMSYAEDAPAEAPFLHIWDGQRWLPVGADRYQAGTFLGNTATRLVVVGPESEQTAVLIEQALAWCPEVLHMETTQVTDLINQLGKVYGFTRSEWEWLAERYQLDLSDLTRDLPRESWYDSHTPGDVPMTERPWKRQKTVDEPAPPPTTSLAPVEDLEEETEEVYHLEME